MQERIDRRIGSDRPVFWMLLLLFVAVAAGGIYLWVSPSRSSVPHQVAVPVPPTAPPAAKADETLPVTLYYPVDGVLNAGTGAVKREADAQTEAHETLAALFTDSRVEQHAIFRDIKLRGFFLDASGTAYVDLSVEQQHGVKASAWEELMAIYSVVDTLTQNFSEIKHVRFLVEGKEAQTLAGHIDLSRVFEKRMDLVKQ